MNDESKSSDSQEFDTPGALLRAAREKRGLQQAGVAERMRLSVQTIIDIENDDHTHFSAEIYLRGHIRSFARIVNLDESEVLRAYESMDISFETDTQHERLLNSQVMSVSTRTRRSKRRALLWVSAAVLLILAIMVALWWREQKSHIFVSLPNASQSKPHQVAEATNEVPIQSLLVVVKKKTKNAQVFHKTSSPISAESAGLVVQKAKPVSTLTSKKKFHVFIPDYKIVSAKKEA